MTIRICTLLKLLIASSLFLPVYSVAEIYKWSDKEGNVHFGDKRPEGQVTEEIEITTGTDTAAPDPGELRRQKLLEEGAAAADRLRDQRRARAEDEKRRIAELESLEKECVVARQELGLLTEQRRIYRDESGRLRASWLHDTYQGEREYVDDADRPAEIDDAKRRVNSLCKGPVDPKAQQEARDQLIKAEWCEFKRAELEAALRPQAHSPSSEIESLQGDVNYYCN